MTARILRCARAVDVPVAARALVVDRLLRAQAGRGRASLALSGGSTPRGLYELLATEGDHRVLDRTQLYFGDERCVPFEHADSNAHMAHKAWTHLFPCDRVHAIRGGDDPDVEAARYEALLSDGGFDVLLLGMGNDAHTASLFPGTPALREISRRVVAVHSGTPQHRRITITPMELLRARSVIVLLSGAAKAPVLRAALTAPVDIDKMPIQLAVRRHPDCVVVADAEAAP